MNCDEFLTQLGPYVDGELGVPETLTADAHSAGCPRCRRLVEGERRFRQLLRRQPRETAPVELRSRVVSRVHRASRIAVLRPWLVASAAAAAVLAAVTFLPGLRQGAPSGEPMIARLVDKHIAYAQLEQPAEFVSRDHAEIEGWFQQRAGLRVVVSDYSPVGIRLVGARIAEANEQKAAYVLYEKGHTLLSVFMVERPAYGGELSGTRMTYRGHSYLAREEKGYRTVSWSEGRTIFGLVSMIEYDALLECADRLRADRAHEARL